MIEVIKIIVSLFVAIAILVTAWTLKNTEYENAWLYIACAWIFILPFIDIYSKKKKDKDE